MITYDLINPGEISDHKHCLRFKIMLAGLNRIWKTIYNNSFSEKNASENPIVCDIVLFKWQIWGVSLVFDKSIDILIFMFGRVTVVQHPGKPY